jgi:ubiquinone/menaquinone biosynthesis C-methylase UbiE
MNKNTPNQHRKYWEKFASKYDRVVGSQGDVSHNKIINPIVLKLAGDLNEKIVLDAGCGNGYLSERLAKTAKRVVGIDFTEELVELAKKRYQKKNIGFKVGNLERLDFLNNYTFDVIVCNMVLMDVGNLSRVVSELSRVLKKSGVLVASITHPCFENPPNTYSLEDKDGAKTGRVVSNYFKTGLVVDESNEYQHFHYTISDYLNNFSKAGLYPERLVEPNGAQILGSKREDHIPYFLIIKFRKKVK